MTQEEIAKQRADVVAEGKTWLKTKFHHLAALKGVGVDCMQFPRSTYNQVLGVDIKINTTDGSYSSQWHLHQTGADGKHEELYLEGLVSQGFVELSDGDPSCEPYQCHRCIAKEEHAPHFIDAKKESGDLVVVRLGYTYAHAGIIVDWPWIVQAESSPCGAGEVTLSTAEANWYFTGRDLKFFSRSEWH